MIITSSTVRLDSQYRVTMEMTAPVVDEARRPPMSINLGLISVVRDCYQVNMFTTRDELVTQVTQVPNMRRLNRHLTYTQHRVSCCHCCQIPIADPRCVHMCPAVAFFMTQSITIKKIKSDNTAQPCRTPVITSNQSIQTIRNQYANQTN